MFTGFSLGRAFLYFIWFVFNNFFPSKTQVKFITINPSIKRMLAHQEIQFLIAAIKIVSWMAKISSSKKKVPKVLQGLIITNKGCSFCLALLPFDKKQIISTQVRHQWFEFSVAKICLGVVHQPSRKVFGHTRPTTVQLVKIHPRLL